ncbi:MAG: AAC(3) family N-acetyltransferase [Deferribacteraceae bacterium]|jgi:aminoglycoside 3-N-acetyltransferase|nr:AAC(3) family N-acetyltransferase [Deferribacteraceae bacterium]
MDYTQYIDHFDIKSVPVLISSDLTSLAKLTVDNGEIFKVNNFIDTIIEKVGNNGTILIPTYNWDFCKGIDFDYKQSACQTGSLGKAALKRSDFKRTQHPIYSFAVWGKDQNVLCEMNNKSSFGNDSPFAYLRTMHAKNLFIDVDLKQAFTYVHSVEEAVGSSVYRFLKDFTAGYINEYGQRNVCTYSMFVRKLELNVQNTINPLEELFIAANVMERYSINQITFRLLDLHCAHDIVANDILYNCSRSICSYDGQG